MSRKKQGQLPPKKKQTNRIPCFLEWFHLVGRTVGGCGRPFQRRNRGYGAFFQSWKQRTRHRRDVRMFLLKLSGEGAPGQTNWNDGMGGCLQHSKPLVWRHQKLHFGRTSILVFAPNPFLACGLWIHLSWFVDLFRLHLHKRWINSKSMRLGWYAARRFVWFFWMSNHMKHLNSPVLVHDHTGGHRVAFSAWRRRTRHRRDVTKMLLKQADAGDILQTSATTKKHQQTEMVRMHRSDEHYKALNVSQLALYDMLNMQSSWSWYR